MIKSLLAEVGCIYLRKLSTSGILYIAKVSLLKHFRNFKSRKKHHVVVMYVVITKDFLPCFQIPQLPHYPTEMASKWFFFTQHN